MVLLPTKMDLVLRFPNIPQGNDFDITPYLSLQYSTSTQKLQRTISLKFLPYPLYYINMNSDIIKLTIDPF